eukprot:2456856-Pyramimonas_sp.AAC.1
MDLSPERWAADRAGPVGWVKTRIEKRLSSNKYTLTAKGKATIGNMAVRKPDGVDLNLGRGPARHGPWIPARATPK